MGVDTRIMLPDDVRVQDVANVMGILAGLPPLAVALCGGHYYTEVDGVSVKSCNIAECCEINLDGEMIDGKTSHYVIYHFEAGKEGGRLLLPRSTPFWQRIGIGLITFFGGKIDLADCDSIDCDMEIPKPRKCNCPESGEEWQKFENEILALKPLSMDTPIDIPDVKNDDLMKMDSENIPVIDDMSINDMNFFVEQEARIYSGDDQ